VSDLLLRQVSAGRAGAEGADDYDVIGADGLVIGRIFKATTAPAGTPWLWTLAYGQHEDRTPTHGHEPTREAAMRAFASLARRRRSGNAGTPRGVPAGIARNGAGPPGGAPFDVLRYGQGGLKGKKTSNFNI
jgi:hypothetical protein